MTDIEDIYLGIGGRFISTFAEMKSRLQEVKAFVFDWDGVFNNGYKTGQTGSGFSEVDSMGTNLLRYSYFAKTGTMARTAILSGEKNETAFYFSEREAFDFCYHKVPHKLEALKHFCDKTGLKPEQIAYFFDDVLDIPLAEVCGVRIMVNQRVNPYFVTHCERHGLVDYLTASSGGQFAVREASELLIAMSGNYEDVINDRKNNSASYKEYIRLKRQTVPELLSLVEDKIQVFDPRKG